MKPSLFVSYSRSQTPFVDRLVEQLVREEYSVWLDYHNLVPAEPWYDQIMEGIKIADIVLLIVSKDSIASKNVEPEWKRALGLKKRIILLVFEAVPLPADLQGCEWVDLRVKYKQGLKQLKNLLDTPVTSEATTPPQSGFKAPVGFWLALILSIVAIIGSIPAWWTLLVPYVLIPLPWQIYKRNYIFSRVVTILLLLPVAVPFSVSLFTEQDSIFYVSDKIFLTFFGLVILVSWPLLGLLLMPVMQRRALPTAARVRFANPLVVDVNKPQPVAFAIDYAPEDVRYADGLRRGLEQHGHRLAGPGENPEASFVLVSTYKTSTEYDPDRQVVYPILLQAVDEIDTNLQRIQWIDFRKGMGHINKLARLLPEPERLLKALSIAPTGSQEIYPLAVNAILYSYLVIGVVGGGAFLTALLQVVSLFLSGTIGMDQMPVLFFGILSGMLIIGASLYSVQGLRSRRGGRAAIYPLLILTILQMLIIYNIYHTFLGTDINVSDVMSSTLRSTVMFEEVPRWMVVIVVPIILYRWKELSRWLPRRQVGSVDRLENLLLLYTPMRQRALVFHALFHAALLRLYYILIAVSPKFWSLYLTQMVIILPFAIGVRWLARRIST